MPIYGADPNAYFMPAYRDIINITNAPEAVVTTTFAHGYLDGAIVRIYIPLNFGMQQINEMQGSITVLSPTTFSITIDSTQMDPFSIPPIQPGWNLTPAHVVNVGEDNDHLDSSFRNILTPLY